MPRSPSPWLLFALFALTGAAGSARAAIDPAAAEARFQEERALCTRDGGRLWGISECGRMMFIDPNDRSVVANQPDAEGLLKPQGPVFVGVLPKDAVISSTAVEWAGQRWTEILWPMPGDADTIAVTLAHENFHRIQPQLGLMRPDAGNGHLDTLDGRYLLQLEWRALARALEARRESDRRAAIADALAFRHERYRLFPGAAEHERDLEYDEGTAEYTGVRIGLPTAEARVRYALHDMSMFAASPSYVRTFAYATGPAMGLLLDRYDPAWRAKLKSGAGLDHLLGAALGIGDDAIGDLKTREARYDPDGALRAHEVQREKDNLARLAAYKAALVDGPVLVLSSHGANYQFRPQTLVALPGHGTVYPTLHVGAPWGALQVDEGGALMDDQANTVVVPLAGATAQTPKGQGWTLTLKPGWAVVPGPRAGDLALAKTGGG